MIKYHGSPCSGDKIAQARFYRARHGLVSFANPDSINIIADVCDSFVLDNGAFSLMNAGKGDIDVHAYINWVLQWSRHPGFDWCLIPDKINGTEEENWELIQQWLRIAPNAKGVPVWHLNESLDYLHWLVSKFEWVALGSSGQYKTSNNPKWWRRISEAMEIICDDEGKPKCKIHGLRMLDPDVFTRIPLSSADSTNAPQNAGSISRFGSYPPPTAEQRADNIASIAENQNSPAVWIPFKQEELF